MREIKVGRRKFPLSLGWAACPLALLFFAGSAKANAVNLGDAANYTVLGIGGSASHLSQFEIYQSDTVINGNVGVGPLSTWTHGMDATINGVLNNDGNADPTITGTITGGLIHNTPAVNQAVADALAASTVAAGLTPTQTFSTLSEGQTIVGNGGLNVIRVTGDITLKTSLTLQGTASDQFVFQLTSNDPGHVVLTLSGMTMNLVGGVTAGNIIWDMNGVGGSIAITSMASNQTVYGTFLAPDRTILVDQGIIDGRVIGGGGPDAKANDTISIHSSSQITAPVVVPVPMSALGGFALLAGLSCFRLIRTRSAAI